MSFLALLFAFLPKLNSGSKAAYLSGYAAFYNWIEDKVVQWHKAELEELDYEYSSLQDSLRLVKAREKARALGIGPLDAKYPSLEDVSPRFRKLFSK